MPFENETFRLNLFPYHCALVFGTEHIGSYSENRTNSFVGAVANKVNSDVIVSDAVAIDYELSDVTHEYFGKIDFL